MRTHQRQHARLLTTLLVGVVMLVWFLGAGFASAQVNTVVNGGSGTNAQRQVVTINNDIRGLIRQLVEKEYNYDPAAFRQKVQNSVAYSSQQIQYLRYGQDGSSFWITNQETYYKELAATTYSNTIEQMQEEANICGNFKTEVLTSLKTQYIEDNARGVSEQNTCELESVTDGNVDAFLEGNSEAGGVQALFAIMKNPGNTPIGAKVENMRRIEAEVEEVIDYAREQAAWGQGYKSVYEDGRTIMACVQKEVNGIRMPGDSNRECRIATPATILRERAANLLQIETQIKTGGDELGETETALMDALVDNVMGRGYSGRAAVQVPGLNLGGGGGGGGVPATCGTGPGTNDPTDPNYITLSGLRICLVPTDVNDQVARQFLGEVATTTNNSNASSTSPIKPVLIRTLTKLQYQLQTIELINNTETRHQDALNDPEYQAIGCYNIGFPNNFSNERTLTQTEIPYTIEALKELYPLFVEYERAMLQNTSTTQIMTVFQTVMQTNFAIPTEVELADIADKFNTSLGAQITDFNREHNQAVSQCELSLNPPPSNQNSSS